MKKATWAIVALLAAAGVAVAYILTRKPVALPGAGAAVAPKPPTGTAPAGGNLAAQLTAATGLVSALGDLFTPSTGAPDPLALGY